MARSKKRRKKRTPPESRRPRSSRGFGKGEYYSPAELFMAALGLVILVVVAGMIVTALIPG